MAGMKAGGGGIIANPNCSTIIALVAVTPLHRAAGVKRMVVSTYQAASGAGQAAMEELELQTREALDGGCGWVGWVGVVCVGVLLLLVVYVWEGEAGGALPAWPHLLLAIELVTGSLRGALCAAGSLRRALCAACRVLGPGHSPSCPPPALCAACRVLGPGHSPSCPPACSSGATSSPHPPMPTSPAPAGKPVTTKIFPFQYAFNLFSHNSPMTANGYVTQAQLTASHWL
jgi:hypothetical protein